MRLKRSTLFITYIIMMVFFNTAASAQQTTVVATQPDAAGLLPEFNRWRTAIGIRPYAEETRLTQAAQFHSDDQVARNYFSHDAPRPVACNGKSVSDLGQRAACFGSFVSGEGIAKGQQTADEATRGWLHSPGHCLGVMDSTATHLGGGHAGDVWTFMYNGVNVPAPNPNFREFCTCTSSSDGSEAALQACVVKFNNGVVPVAPPPSSLQLSYQLPNATGSYNNRNSGGMGLGVKAEGTYTITVVPVTGNPTGISMDLKEAVGRNNVDIPGTKSTDKLVYTITSPKDLYVWFDSSKLAAGDTFRFNVLWESSYVAPVSSVAAAPTEIPAGEPTAVPADTTATVAEESTCTPAVSEQTMDINIINNTDQPLTLGWYSFDCVETAYGTVEAKNTLTQGTFVGHVWVLRAPDGSVVRQFTAAADQTDIIIDPVNPAEVIVAVDTNTGTNTTAAPASVGCAFTVGTVDEMANAINQANDEAACPGTDSIVLTSNLEISAGYNGTDSAFPAITSTIIVEGQGFTLNRQYGLPEFRFFLVKGADGNIGELTLKNTSLIGGLAMDGGAVFVDSPNGGNASIMADNVKFINNTAHGNGGAVMTFSMNGGAVVARFDNSTFEGNTGSYGGAFYSGGFDGGDAAAIIVKSTFDNNTALIEGGTIYNNGLGANGKATMSIDDSTIIGSTSPRGDAVHSNGRTGGNARLVLNNNTFTATAFTLEPVIFNQGAEGIAIMNTNDTDFGGAENLCFAQRNGTYESITCP